MNARDLAWLRLASIVEALTLLTLVGVAVPLKHLWGFPQAVAVMGPLHGLAFLTFGWRLMQTAAAGDWPPAEIVRAAALACAPFGGFINERRFAAMI